MRKTSLMLGMLISVLLHALVFLPALSDARRAEHQPERAADDRGKLTVARTPVPTPTEPAAPPVQEPDQRVPERTPAAAPQLKELEKMADASADMPEIQHPGDIAADSDSDSFPRMRILWSGIDELRSVARFFGMRVVAVDGRGDILGRVSLEGEMQLMPSGGDSLGFSNRVRSLPPDFFEGALPSAVRRKIRDFWVLVPADVDSRFMAIQEQAIKKRGMAASQVATVEARFAPTGQGRYSLVITNVIPL